jgi:hypothetical protein
MQGEFFLKINKRADQNKAVQGFFFFSKLINVHARLFGTLEYLLWHTQSGKNWASVFETIGKI